MQHTCIKPGCGATYEDNDPDAYYCSVCNDQRKIIAKEVDAKLAGRVTKNVVSDLQAYDNALKIRGFVNAKTFL